MAVRSHHVAASLFTAAAVILASVWFGFNPATVSATCGTTGLSIIITDPTTSSGPLSSVRSLRAYTSPVSAIGLGFILMGGSSGQLALGEAVQQGTGSGSYWKLDWDSRNVTNGAYQLMAIAHFGSSIGDCASPVMPVNIQNTPTQAPTLKATLTPASWQTTVGTSRTFSVDALYTDQYGRQSHVGPTTTGSFMWHTSIGSLTNPSGISTVLAAGNTVGTGQLMIDITYSGLTAHAVAGIKIDPATTSGNGSSGTGGGTTSSGGSTNPTPSPSPSASADGSAATTEDTTRLAAMPTIFRPGQPTNSSPTVNIPTLSCLEKKVGQARFAEISNGKVTPTPAERRLMAGCFSGPEAIPAVLAPVTPAKITEVEETKNLVSVGEIKNTTITNDEGKKVTGLLVTGKGVPNSSVFIYIFSDPLVLRAQTDSQGVWSYVLETPLKPGKHEVYAVAEKDSSSFVRTSAVPISIAAAAPGSQDGSLIIERTWSPTQIGFVILAGLLVLAGLGVLGTVLLRQRRRAKKATETGPLVTPSTPAASTATPDNSTVAATAASTGTVVAPVVAPVGAPPTVTPTPAPAPTPAGAPTTVTPPTPPGPHGPVA